MPANTLETISLSQKATSNLSMIDLFMHADWIVQFVMILLLGASFWCWTIIIAKAYKLMSLKSRATSFEETFWSGGSLEKLYDRIGDNPVDPLSSLFVVGMREWRRSNIKSKNLSHELRATIQQRIERVMNTSLSREIESLENYMTFLASIGSTAPFIGLFGTVWGIMHSFQSIAASQSTNLAVVAPGIAEALFATALGLIAAIPAVLGYNKLSAEINRYANRLESFSLEFVTLISRHLESEE